MTKPTILVVENNPINRKNYRVCLQQEEYNVLIAEDGASALKLAGAHKVDLILQDLVLPDVSGIELSRQFRAITHNDDVTIIALSGFLNHEEAQSSAFSTFLLKPIEPVQLIKTIKDYLPTFIQEEQATQPKLVLIIDDNLAQLKLLKRQLNQVGYQVITAENGEEALKKILNNPPDAVISDVLLSGMNAFELCYELRNDAHLSQIPIILLTSNDLEERDLLLAKKVKANYYLTRTIDAKKLINTLKECFPKKSNLLKSYVSNLFLNTKKLLKNLKKHLQKETKLSKLSVIKFFNEEHIHRLVKQLDQQININFDLAQQCTLQKTQLSLLGGIAEALIISGNTQDALKEVLADCLDSAGISMGLLYLVADEDFFLSNSVGFSKQDITTIETYFANTSFLKNVTLKRKVVHIHSSTTMSSIEKILLHHTQATSILIIPILSGVHCYGAILLGSQQKNISEKQFLHFSQALSTQLGQSLALTTIFDKLTESENRSRVLMEHAGSGIFVIDEKGMIKKVNAQGQKILQCEKQDIIGHHFINFVATPYHQTAQTLLRQLLQKGILDISELQAQRKDNTTAIIEFSAVRVSTKGEKLSLLIVNDVTERNSFRMHAILKDRLDITGKLLDGVAHEINNPVAWILSNLNFLKKQLQLKNKANQTIEDWKASSITEEVIVETILGAERIRDIVQLFKNFGGENSTENTLVDIHEILNSSINMAALEYKYRAKLEKKFSSNIPKILACSGQLQQVFLNILVNAAHAIPEGNIEQNKIHVITTLEKDNIHIKVEDTGVGIDPAILPKIFDPFFSTKPSKVGTGLGLAISYEIVRKFGGTINVESKPGKGSIFNVCLPLHNSESFHEENNITSR